MELIEALETTKFSIIDFYADWCGPCKAIKPKFKELCKAYAKKFGIFLQLDTKDLGFFACNTQKVPEANEYYSIKAIPYFGFFVEMDLKDSLTGAGNIEGKIESFVQSCKSKGLKERENHSSDTQNVVKEANAFTRFNPKESQFFKYLSENHETPLKKIQALENQFSENEKKVLSQMLNDFTKFSESQDANESRECLKFLFKYSFNGEGMSADCLPFVDLLKSLILKEKFANVLAQEFKFEIQSILNFLKSPNKVGIQTIMLRFLCNMISSNEISEFIFSDISKVNSIIDSFQAFALESTNNSLINAYGMVFYNISVKLQSKENIDGIKLQTFFQIYLNPKTNVYGENNLLPILTGLCLIAHRHQKSINFTNELQSQLDEKIKNSPEINCQDLLKDLKLILSK